MKLQWDVFCRVIDNFGDIGVSWRLACELAARGQTVRLWLDDASALRWMAPEGSPAGLEVRPWSASSNEVNVGDVVIETFGCELPDAFVARMASKAVGATPPHWINLEYLSAESYVERSHGLSSPQFSGPGAGLSKQFFYPGFTAETGGLLREPGLLEAQAQFDPAAWLAGLGVQRRPGERIVSLFAYPQKSLPALLAQLAKLAQLTPEPTLLLVCPGKVQDALSDAEKAGLSLPSTWRWQALPYLSQRDFDHLLWAADLNLVRGEDSFVRAQWAGKPFVWQIYPQADGAHGPKLEAFMDLWLAQAEPALARQMRALWRAWNGLQSAAAGADQLDSSLPYHRTAAAHALQWREVLAAQPDLSTQLMRWVGGDPGKSS
ncbi:elongation factor P maturation arginine rhamnosyltransferase EarP [Roseateles sp. GG27B]